ncbi:nstp-5 [Pristionchus pacificus]|nr:nstp-5 [Pristionchus pacificus]
MISDETMQKTIKYSSLGVLVLQNTSLVLFMRFAMTGDRPKFIKAITVFYGEIFKFVASLILCCFSHRSFKKGLADIYTECVHKKTDFAKVLIPAVIYTIQNVLLYVAVENLPAATFMVTYQLKILTTALFTVVVLKRPLSKEQWIALFFLFAGVAVVQYDQKMSEDREKALLANKVGIVNGTEMPLSHNADELENAFTNLLGSSEMNESWNGESTLSSISSTTVFPISSTPSPHRKAKGENSVIGFVSVLTACVMSGFAGIYFEKILKGSSVSIWVRNFQLAGPSIVFSLLFAFGKDNSLIFRDGFNPISVFSNMMQGFDWAVWTTVAISALGGLIVAVVIKFADNILKAFATSFAIVFNCVLAYFLFSFRPTILFVVGACMVIGAVFGYSIYPARSTHKPLNVEEAKETEMKNLEGELDRGKNEEEKPLNVEA